jgi:Kelch motif
METVSIYDITSQEWHLQNTTGDIPPQLTMFCSVVAPAQDGSSFNIYIYGGYNGINQTDIPSDNVYILSVPQMVWTLAYTGQSNHGRSGHKCIRVYPDQMMVLGGIYAGTPTICLDGGIIEVFNLNKLEFQDSYDPRLWDEYVVPDAITSNIGGK